MKISRIEIPKKKLMDIPEVERIFLIQLGHISNELNFLNKLLIFTGDTKKTGPERKAMTMQSLVIVRIFVGKLFESWKMLERDYFRAKLSVEYDRVLSVDGKSSLDYLKNYFKGKNLITSIRNKYSFHYDSDDFGDAVSSFDEDKKFELYLGENYSNTLHFFSEEIMTVGMLKLTGEKDVQKSMDKLIGELVAVSGKFIDFAGHALTSIFDKYLGESLNDFISEEINITTEADLELFKIPFFVERGS